MTPPRTRNGTSTSPSRVPEAAGPESLGPEPAGPEPAGPEPAGPEPAGPEPAGPEPAGPEPAGPEIVGLGYEQARDELVEIVRRLEAGGATLEESLALWERGEALARCCEQWLDGARARLQAAQHQPPAAPVD